jgi:hypothetical protein
MARKPTPIPLQTAITIIMGKRYSLDIRNRIGSDIIPRLINSPFIYPIWSPAKRIRHITAIAVPPVKDGE